MYMSNLRAGYPGTLADLDSDGDSDILCCGMGGSGGVGISWLESSGGPQPMFSMLRTVSTTPTISLIAVEYVLGL